MDRAYSTLTGDSNQKLLLAVQQMPIVEVLEIVTLGPLPVDRG
jgi:hypothetical protein